MGISLRALRSKTALLAVSLLLNLLSGPLAPVEIAAGGASHLRSLSSSSSLDSLSLQSADLADVTNHDRTFFEREESNGRSAHYFARRRRRAQAATADAAAGAANRGGAAATTASADALGIPPSIFARLTQLQNAAIGNWSAIGLPLLNPKLPTIIQAAAKALANGPAGSTAVADSNALSTGFGSAAVADSNALANGPGSTAVADSNALSSGIGSTALTNSNALANGPGSTAVADSNALSSGIGSTAVADSNALSNGPGSTAIAGSNALANGPGATAIADSTALANGPGATGVASSTAIASGGGATAVASSTAVANGPGSTAFASSTAIAVGNGAYARAYSSSFASAYGPVLPYNPGPAYPPPPYPGQLQFPPPPPPIFYPPPPTLPPVLPPPPQPFPNPPLPAPPQPSRPRPLTQAEIIKECLALASGYAFYQHQALVANLGRTTFFEPPALFPPDLPLFDVYWQERPPVWTDPPPVFRLPGNRVITAPRRPPIPPVIQPPPFLWQGDCSVVPRTFSLRPEWRIADAGVPSNWKSIADTDVLSKLLILDLSFETSQGGSPVEIFSSLLRTQDNHFPQFDYYGPNPERGCTWEALRSYFGRNDDNVMLKWVETLLRQNSEAFLKWHAVQSEFHRFVEWHQLYFPYICGTGLKASFNEAYNDCLRFYWYNREEDYDR